MQRHGGHILVDHLKSHGTRRVFSVPGESFLAVLDGLHDSDIHNVVCRHEGGAAMMAEAYGKMTGTPGVAIVTRGPGATNASSGVHVARQDSTPMILLVGQIDSRQRGRETFQEVDYRQTFGDLAKWVAEVDHTDRLPEMLSRAYIMATTGRPGPVVLALPEDMLSAVAKVADRAPMRTFQPSVKSMAKDAMRWLSGAKRPLVIVGGPHWSRDAGADLAAFAGAQNVPVALGFRRQDYLDNRHDCYAGDLNVGINPALAARVKQADRLLVIGSRLGDIETQGYTLIDPDTPHCEIMHIHAEAEEPGHVYATAFRGTARADTFVQMLARQEPCKADWADWTAAARADYLQWITPHASPGAVQLEQVVKHLSDTLPEDAIVTNGAGNYAAWLHRYFVYKGYGTQLAPTSGSMGYGFPAAVSASLEYPDKTVVCMAGDGCFQMTLNEMSTAIQHGAKPIVVVCNNGQYGTIRMHQERHYPARVSGTQMANPDFAALAQAYGGFGITVAQTEDFAEAFQQAQGAGTLAVIELKLDPEALSTGKTLSETRASS